MLYLWWIIAALVNGAVLMIWLSLYRKEVSMRRKFSEIESFMGRSYAEIRAIAQTSPQEIVRKEDGQTLRIWREEDYSIALLFDERDICLGVEEERS